MFLIRLVLRVSYIKKHLHERKNKPHHNRIQAIIYKFTHAKIVVNADD